MTDINSVVLVGRLTRDIDANERAFGYLPNGTPKATVSLAVNRSVKRGDNWEDETSFIDVTIFGKPAENLRPYLKKGTQVGVQGSLRQDRWEKDGQKHSKLYVVADMVRLLSSKRDGGTGSSYNNSTSSYSNSSASGASGASAAPAGQSEQFEEPPEEEPLDIPF